MRWRTLLKAIPFARPAGRWLRRHFHPHYRAVRAAQRSWPGQMMQPEGTTADHRYPVIFAFVAEQLAGKPRPRILSWGCSHGEELLALRAAVPGAEIVGVDINRRSLEHARRRVEGDPLISLLHTGDPQALAGERFDAVLCMAVLRHADLEERRPPTCTAVLPFARAEALVSGLTALLQRGGLLALWNVHFRLIDMAVAGRFETALALDRGHRINQPLYGRDDSRLAGAECTGAVFRLTS